VGQLLDRDVGTERAGSRPHDLLDRLVLAPLELLGPQQAKDDPLVVHDHARVPSGRPHPLVDLADRFVEPTGRHVPAGHITGSWPVGVPALGRQAGGQPVEFSVHLGAHLIDQALHLFGLPATVMADVGAQRPGAVVDDYFHMLLGYGQLRVILHAGSLVRARVPHFEVHGDKGSFVKYGMDPQEEALRSGRRPGDPGWGTEPSDRYGTITTEAAGLELTGRLASVPGAYEAFYAGMAAAILGEGQVPVPPEEARNTIWMIECALRSSREGRVIQVAS
jgi:predicted dehydrogenase